MADNKKCAGLNYEAEYHRLCEEKEKMSMEINDMKNYFGAMERNNAIMQAQLDIVYLIFGGRNRG